MADICYCLKKKRMKFAKMTRPKWPDCGEIHSPDIRFRRNIQRFCLWKDSTETERKKSAEIKKRIEAVKKVRSESTHEPTQKLAETPYLFGEIRQTDPPYLLIPKVSSETRRFIPMGYVEPSVICKDSAFMIPNATIYDFGLLTSTFHNAWMRSVGGVWKAITTIPLELFITISRFLLA